MNILEVEVLAFPTAVDFNVTTADGKLANITSFRRDVTDHVTSARWSVIGRGTYVVRAENNIGASTTSLTIPSASKSERNIL